MKAWVYLNEAEDHFRGFRGEHIADLQAAGLLTIADYADDIDALEVAFQICNGADPQSDVMWYDHGFRSLSVGDCVLLMADNLTCQRFYYCQPSGWGRVTPSPVRIAEVNV